MKSKKIEIQEILDDELSFSAVGRNRDRDRERDRDSDRGGMTPDDYDSSSISNTFEF